jgi:hypothetical protein
MPCSSSRLAKQTVKTASPSPTCIPVTGAIAVDLILPKGLQGTEDAARRMLAKLPDVLLRQSVADEWAGQLRQPGKLHSPLGYLHRLVERTQAGTFVPNLAVEVAQDREKRLQNEAALAWARYERPEAANPAPEPEPRKAIPIFALEKLKEFGRFGSRRKECLA